MLIITSIALIMLIIAFIALFFIDRNKINKLRTEYDELIIKNEENLDDISTLTEKNEENLDNISVLMERYEESKNNIETLVIRFEQIMTAFEDVDQFLYIMTKSKLFSSVYIEHEPMIADLLTKIKNLKLTIGSMFNMDHDDIDIYEENTDEEI
jgi:hypothetical protein